MLVEQLNDLTLTLWRSLGSSGYHVCIPTRRGEKDKGDEEGSLPRNHAADLSAIIQSSYKKFLQVEMAWNGVKLISNTHVLPSIEITFFLKSLSKISPPA